MMKLNIVNHIDEHRLIQFLHDIDEEFFPRLSDRISIQEYAHKLLNYAKFFVSVSDSKITGVVAVYCNDIRQKMAYCSFFGVPAQYSRFGTGSELLNAMIEYIRNAGFERLELNTMNGGIAQLFYQRHGFKIVDAVAQSRNITGRISMRLWLGNINNSLAGKQTPLEYLNIFSTETGVNVFIKRDDLFFQSGGGNKSRKLLYILEKAENKGYNAIVTAGGIQSNHLRATALMAAKSGWKAILVIHDPEPGQITGNLKIATLAGAELRFVDKAEVGAEMSTAMNDFRTNGYNPLYIWGGGHCLEGSFAYYEALKELKEQLGNIKPDFIVVASGTGTTQAGLEIGVRQYYPGCKILGVSVSKNADEGKSTILKSMKELNDFLDNPVDLPDDIFFDDQWIGAGYGSYYPELLETIKCTAKSEGLILDPVYTGKAFHALKKYIENGEIQAGSNVIFWHTGGLINLLDSNII